MLWRNPTTFRSSRFDQQDWWDHLMKPPSRRRSIMTAEGCHAGRCIEILTLAFASDAAARWIFPEPSRYLRWFPEFVRVFGGAAFASGAAHVADDCAVALWLPPGVQSDDAAFAALIEESVPERRRGAVFALFDQMSHYYPKTPHWHLPLIGVDPRRQRQGYGAALLRAMLARLDKEQSAAYLEATSAENAALYERHGFEVIGVIQAGTSPSVFPMWRKPAGG
jgi:GNAT superfamily N-acetyltransferase